MTFTIKPDGWVIDGELNRCNAASLRAWYECIDSPHESVTLEMAGLDILDTEGVAAAIEAIRELLQRTSTLTIVHAPHLLAHTLYRIGMLEAGGRLGLREPRQEEPYG